VGGKDRWFSGSRAASVGFRVQGSGSRRRRGSPRRSTIASRAYGTRASSRVREAPGTDMIQPKLWAAPPVTWTTARTGDACTASTARRIAGSIACARAKDGRLRDMRGTQIKCCACAR
jgi:hypothetical protein